MLNIAVTGAAGRMGKAIINTISEAEGAVLTGALEHSESPSLGADAGDAAGAGHAGVKITDDMDRAFKKAGAIIDFSHPDVTMKAVEYASAKGVALVIGTTGLSHSQREAVAKAAERTRIVMAPNMSVGVNLMLKLVEAATSVIGSDYDIEIIEAHHRHKKDAPSGTALRIAEVITNTLKVDLDSVAVYERKGIIGERTKGEIGMQTIRAGDIVGDHTVMFATPGERVEITHKASSRETFSKGAVRAALWLEGRESGLYDMQDVLGLK